MRVYQITAPTTDPLTLDEVKLHLRVTGDDEDTLIDGLLKAATSYLDGWTGILGRALESQTWEMALDEFPDEIELPLGPITSVTSVKYTDTTGTEQTMSALLYQTDIPGVEGRIVAPDGWPVTGDYVNAVKVRWVAGLGAAQAIKQAMLLLIGHWYVNREIVGDARAELPLAFTALVAPFRRVGV